MVPPSLGDLVFVIMSSGIGLFFAGVIAVLCCWSLSTHFIWASRIRRLLDQEGFRVRHLERRWLTRGPFPDLKRAGTKGHTEWLVRVVAEDREHRPRAGWVRWRRKWPWEAVDTWAVHWDEAPWNAAASARASGLSTRVFFTLLLIATAVMMVIITKIWGLADS
jgi:hypothetical protein